MIGSFIDRAIATVAPGWALRNAMNRARFKALSTYGAADTGRRNKDWKTTSGSADLALIPDFQLMNARSRQLVRDSWVAQSAVHCAERNIVGRGITPVPAVREIDGSHSPRTRQINQRLSKWFWEWASDPNLCDVEKRQTFWQKQSLAVSERLITGNAFTAWSFQPGTTGVGLRLQSFETEQLYNNIQNFGQNQVRWGVEVDDVAAPVAYHFYTRTPNDYLPRNNYQPIRIPKERCLHFFLQARVRQVLGETAFHAVMQDARDFYSLQQAHLWRTRMEACFGAAITTSSAPPLPGVAGGVGFTPGTGDTGFTDSGMRKLDWVPGMTAILQPGETIEFNAPQSAGGNYAPFAEQILRGIAAGLNISYEQLVRDFSRGSYSSQRQSLLEDRRAWAPPQDALIDQFISQIYRLFVSCCFSEGRLDDLVHPAEYAASPARFAAATYQPDGYSWIDPWKEIKAHETAIALRLETREEIIASKGGRYLETQEKIAEEKRVSQELNIPYPEDVESDVKTMQTGSVIPPAAAGAAGQPGKPAAKPAKPAAPRPAADPSEPPDPETQGGFDDFDFSVDDDPLLAYEAAPISAGGRVISAPTDTLGPNDTFETNVLQDTVLTARRDEAIQALSETAAAAFDAVRAMAERPVILQAPASPAATQAPAPAAPTAAEPTVINVHTPAMTAPATARLSSFTIRRDADGRAIGLERSPEPEIKP